MIRMVLAMMTANIQNMSKLDYTINSALMLGYVCYAKGDNVGLVAFSDKIEAYIPPRRGKKQLYHIIEALYGDKEIIPLESEVKYQDGRVSVIRTSFRTKKLWSPPTCEE